MILTVGIKCDLNHQFIETSFSWAVIQSATKQSLGNSIKTPIEDSLGEGGGEPYLLKYKPAISRKEL